MKDQLRKPEILQVDPVEDVFDFFQGLELGGKPIPGTEQLIDRLAELQAGRQVPVVIFNCLDFQWKYVPRQYPQSVIADGVRDAICGFFEPNVKMYMNKLRTLGSPELNIIVPDSELLDDRPFSFSQRLEERKKIGEKVKINLSERLNGLRPYGRVVLWSEYCVQNGLPSPLDYTTQNIDRIKDDPELSKKVMGQVKDSKRYFVRRGLSEQYVDSIEDQMIGKTTAYLAMYAGEGQALAESKAIVINLEDQRVSAWFQRGANDQLPILTPVNPTVYYKWRNENKGIK